MPAHGDVRNQREETTYGACHTLVDARTGAEVYSGPMSSHTRTVCEKYCAVCGEWGEVRGILGLIEWGEEHRHEDVARAEATM